jgi:transketolase
MYSITELETEAIEIRKRTLGIIYKAGGGHTGGSMSLVDILTALYFSVLKIDPNNLDDFGRDRFILSKGHSVEGYYSVLARRGFIDDALLDTYGKFNSELTGHPTRKTKGIELNSGALGHGLSVGVGMALASKRQKSGFRTFVLMGDGEHGEGSIMEAAASAGHYKLDNLVAIVDRNNLQISGPTEDVLAIEDVRKKYEANGWAVTSVDGHDIKKLIDVFNSCPLENGKPTFIIANTIKGKGASFMENKAVWHHKVPNETELKLAIEELNARKEALNV